MEEGINLCSEVAIRIRQNSVISFRFRAKRDVHIRFPETNIWEALDRLGEFSETTQRFPDISFGKTYVNITLRPESDEADAVLTDADRSFAVEIDALIR